MRGCLCFVAGALTAVGLAVAYASVVGRGSADHDPNRPQRAGDERYLSGRMWT